MMGALGYVFGLLPPWLWPLLAAGVLAWSWAGGYGAGKESGLAVGVEQRERLAQRVEEANRRAHQAGEHYERRRQQDAVRSAARTKEVNRALQADDRWAAVELPAGVRDALADAAGDVASSEPD
jgi:hypothetical protein